MARLRAVPALASRRASVRDHLRPAAPERDLAAGAHSSRRGVGPNGGGTTSTDGLVERLARAEIGSTYNQYARSPVRRARLAAYLERRAGARVLLVGEAAGYLGARVSGLPFTSERQLTGRGPGEATATVVHRVLAELGLEDDVLLWNVVPTHPGTPASNRRPTPREVEAGLPFVHALAGDRRVLAVGRVAETALGAPYVRHPSHGGAGEFRAGLAAILDA